MTHDRVVTAAAPELRRLDRAQIEPWLERLSAWLLPSALYPVQHTWPQLYRRDGDGVFAGVFVGDELVSHCAWRFVDVRTPAILRVALLGSVATATDQRGHGHATRLLQHAVDDCRAHGAAAILLWAERPELYARVGFRRGSVETCLLLDRRLFPAPAATTQRGTARLATVADHDRLRELHEQKALGVVRDRRAMSLLLTTPGLTTCVLERDGRATAYACHGKGADLQGWWHEFGGDDSEIAALLPGAMEIAGLDHAFALVPPDRVELASLVAEVCLDVAAVDGPMVLPLRDDLPPFWIDGLDSV